MAAGTESTSEAPEAAASDSGSAGAPADRGRRAIRLAVTFLVLFGVCVALVLPDGRATRLDVEGVPANSRIETVLANTGIEDVHYYLSAGHEMARVRGLPPARAEGFVSDRFALEFWPPGMALYYAALFSIFGPDMPVGVVAALVMAALWALVLTAIVDLLARSLPMVAVVLMPAIVLLSDISRDWIFGPMVFWSEGLYTFLLLGALYAAARTARARSGPTRLGWAATVGVAVGLSAYVRSIGDLFGWLMLAGLVAWALVILVRFGIRAVAARRRTDAEPVRLRWGSQFVCLLLCVGAFQAVTVPWRIYSESRLRPGDYSWSTEGTKLWRDSWMTDAYLRERGFSWLLAGRPNSACQVDRRTCREIAAHELRQDVPYSGEGRYTSADYRRLAVDAMARHPVAYARDRLEFLRVAWFWTPRNRATDLVQNGLLTVAVLLALALSVRRLVLAGPDLVALLFPGLLVVSLAPLAVIHFEARYFFTVKLVAVVAVFVLAALDPAGRFSRALGARPPRPPGTAAEDRPAAAVQ